MNRYFYVPVMDACVKHEGVSLRDHLRVVDSELFDRECRYFNELCDFSFEDGIMKAKNIKNADRQNSRTSKLYQERLLPRFLVLVSSGSRLYELASEVDMDPISLGMLQNFEISGFSVIDVFMDNPEYTPCARNFFDIYEQNKELLKEPQKKTLKQKVLQRFPFLPSKNS